MQSPFPKSASSSGKGHVVVRPLPSGGSGLQSVTYQYPLKLISPSQPSSKESALVFLLSYGGGLVGGDSVTLRVDILPGARLSIVTQGHTKIFKSPTPDVVTRQTLDAWIRKGAALCLLPDPVQPFGGSVYEQVQHFHVDKDASVCLLDWVTQGRIARGENWSFAKWVGKNEIWESTLADHLPEEGETPDRGRLMVRDTVILSQDKHGALAVPLREQMHDLELFGTLILRGAMFQDLSGFMLAEFSALPRIGARGFSSGGGSTNGAGPTPEDVVWRRERLLLEAEQKILWTAALVRGCVVVKFGAATVEAGRRWIGSMITREGSVARLFGDDALLCLR